MRPTLRLKLTLSFLLISIISFITIGAFANIVLEKQFREYVIDKLDQKKDSIVSMLGDQYDASQGAWDLSAIENLGVSALTDGLILRLSDENGAVVWDAMMHNEGFCADMLRQMAENMNKQYGSFQGGYTENNYQITDGGSLVGTVTVGYYGPYFYSDTDLLFLNTLNKLLLLGTGMTAVIAVFIGTFTAKRLSRPIACVIKKAEEISDGNYSGRIAEKTNTREILELTESINTLAESLGNQEALRKRLTADVAHELRTPIANLQSHLEAMIDGVWKADTERLKGLHEETVRLGKIVSDLESLARYESDKLQLNLEDIDVSHCLRKTLKSFESEFAKKSIVLDTHITEQHAVADRDKLTQALTNIVSNALKYTPDGGRITAAVSGDADCVHISVRDTGIGISQEDLPFIFERFFRADRSRSRDTGGAGIGLAIVKSLIEAHGGTVCVESEPGKGSEFIISLPKKGNNRQE